ARTVRRVRIQRFIGVKESSPTRTIYLQGTAGVPTKELRPETTLDESPGTRHFSGAHGLCLCSVDAGGPGESSDQRLTGRSSTVGSNGPLSVPRMGEAFSPAPQASASPCGTKNITCGNQGPAESSLT